VGDRRETSPGPDFANGPVHVASERPRIGGWDLLLQVLGEKTKLKLRRDHASQERQALFWFQGFDPFSQISNFE